MKRRQRANRQTTRHATRDQFQWEKERNAHACLMAVFTLGFFFPVLFFSIQEHIEFFLDRLSLSLPKNLCPGGKISIACVTPFFSFLFFSLGRVDLQHRRSELWTVCVQCALPKYVPYVCTAYLEYVGLLLFFRSFSVSPFTSFDAPIHYVAFYLKKYIYKSYYFFFAAQRTNGLWENKQFFHPSWRHRTVSEIQFHIRLVKISVCIPFCSATWRLQAFYNVNFGESFLVVREKRICLGKFKTVNR